MNEMGVDYGYGYNDMGMGFGGGDMGMGFNHMSPPTAVGNDIVGRVGTDMETTMWNAGQSRA